MRGFMEQLARAATAMGERVEVWEYPDGNTFGVSIPGCDIEKGPFLLSTSGTGKTVEMAAKDYLEKIAGKPLVVNATSEEYRRAFTVFTLADPGREVEERR